jgi:hypothetical protein
LQTVSQMQRLADQIFKVFNEACEQRRLDVAEVLLAALELSQRSGEQGREERGAREAEAAFDLLRRLRLDDNPVH